MFCPREGFFPRESRLRALLIALPTASRGKAPPPIGLILPINHECWVKYGRFYTVKPGEKMVSKERMFEGEVVPM